MNYLEKAVYGSVWDEKDVELGTFVGEKERIGRNDAKKDVIKAFYAGQEFTQSLTTAHMVEAALEYFGMETRDSLPTKNAPPVFEDKEEEKSWVTEKLNEIVDTFIFPCWSGKHEKDTIVIRGNKIIRLYVMC